MLQLVTTDRHEFANQNLKAHRRGGCGDIVKNRDIKNNKMRNFVVEMQNGY